MAFSPSFNQVAQPPTPIKEAIIPSYGHPLANITDLLPPPSPRTHRALRKLQSAHDLGARAADPSPLSPITPQFQQPPHVVSPAHHELFSSHVFAGGPPSTNDSRLSSHHVRQRVRANSDAPPMGYHCNSTTANKRSVMSINPRYTSISLTQLIREGPLEDDVPEALGAARRRVLSEGIKADTDGMVRLPASYRP